MKPPVYATALNVAYTPPVIGELAVKREIQHAQLEVDEVRLAGQIADRLDFGGTELAPSRQRLQVVPDVWAQRPGILVADVDFHRPIARRSRDRVRGTHVEPQKSERRKVARAQQPVMRG